MRMPATAFEHSGFRAWATSGDFPEGVRAAFVDGEVLVEMSPESIETHNKVKTAITIALGTIISTEDLGEAWSDGTLLTNTPAALSTEPDFAFATWKSLESGRVALVQKANRTDEFVEITGCPDLVVEVVSDSSERKDFDLLRVAYARAGIPEYWIVDARQELLHFEILQLGGGAYRVGGASGQPQISRILARSFALERSRNRLQRWTYVLRVTG